MVGIIERVEQIFMEGVDILEAREAIEDERELLGECFLSELDLSGVEIYKKKALN